MAMQTMKSNRALWLLAAILGVWLAFTGPAAAGEAAPDGLAAAPLASWQSFYNQFENFIFNSVRSRERMIQVIIVGMTIGLFVMLRKMPGKD